jgi:hypothetical protein
MDFSLSNSVIQIAIGALVGFVFGVILMLIISGFANRSRSRRARSTELRTKGRYQEIVRLWRDPASGKIVTELRGNTFSDPSSLSTKEHEYLARNSRDWAAWLSISIASTNREAANQAETTPVTNAPASQPAAEEQVVSVPQPALIPAIPDFTGEPAPQSSVRIVPAEMSPEPLPPVLRGLPPVLKESLPVEGSGPSFPAAVETPPLFSPAVSAPGQVAQPAAPVFTPQVTPRTATTARAKTPTAPLSIVEQVDQILQEKIAQLPPPAPVVLLKEDPREGVIVWINGVQHIGIDSVRDESIKSIIRASVKEWERHNEHK